MRALAGPAAWILCVALAGGAQAADAPPAAPPSVKVNAIKDPEMRSYRSIWAGIEAFDEYHALAPGASLRFQMTHADGGPANAADGLQLRLASNDGSAPVRIDADGRFTVARDRGAYEADATYILNKKNGLYTARPDIRTPGLPDNVRRLGDLRLECRVLVAIIKEQLPFLAKAAINSLFLTSDWCGKKDVNFSFVADREVAGAWMRSGGRTQELQAEGWRYMAPVGSKDWPDDALIELRYAAPAPQD
jgi:hypothetical protein